MTREKLGPEMHQRPPAENKNGHRMSLGFEKVEKQAHIADAAKTYKGDTVGRMNFLQARLFHLPAVINCWSLRWSLGSRISSPTDTQSVSKSGTPSDEIIDKTGAPSDLR